VKKLIFSWLGFCLVVVLSFISCGFFIYFLSKADYSFNKLIVSRHNSLLAFSNINSLSPAVLSKEEFLNEVRYLGNLKEDVDVLEEGILGRIFAAFQLHPWVYKVVEIQREGANNLKVVLEFRVPAMVVPLVQEKVEINTAEKFRVVDVNGVILPINAMQIGLPVLATPLPFPTDKAGIQWKNDQVISCSKILGYLAEILLPKDCLIEMKDGLVLVYSEKVPFKIIWGPLSDNESLAFQEIDQRKTILKTKYSSWIQTAMRDSLVIDFSVNIPK
jgi:hypothetical protein